MDNLDDAFFEKVISMGDTNNIIISDQEIFEEIGYYKKTERYVKINPENINHFIKNYIEQILPKTLHYIFYYPEEILNSKYSFLYFKEYKHMLDVLEYEWSKYRYDGYYLHSYKHNHVLQNRLFIKPDDFNLFKIFINKYYSFMIENLKICLTFLIENIRSIAKDLEYKHDKLLLLNILNEYNEAIIIQLKIDNIKRLNVPLMYRIYILKRIIYKHTHYDNPNDIRNIILEIFRYEYFHILSLPKFTAEEIITIDMFNFKL